MDDDERELYRLCNMLKEVDRDLDINSPLREAVSKGALALLVAYNRGFRKEIELCAKGIDQPLGDTQRAFLASIGIDAKDSCHSEDTDYQSQAIDE